MNEFQTAFNSTMVRLKVHKEHAAIVSKYFQFHYGTIKRNEYNAQMLQKQTFNSTMVRLKV